MLFGTISLVTTIVLSLAIVLVALAAGSIRHSNKRFTEGKVKELGFFVFLSMMALLGKLLTDFAKLILPPLGISTTMPQVLEIFGIVFIVLTALFLIKVAALIKQISKMFGFKAK